MQKYRSHKVVEAVKIASVTVWGIANQSCEIIAADGLTIRASSAWYARFCAAREAQTDLGNAKGMDRDTGYYVRYDDNFDSWSPSKAFEEGYTSIEPETIDPEAPGVTDADLPADTSRMGIAGTELTDDERRELDESIRKHRGTIQVQQPAPQIRRPRAFDLENATQLYAEIAKRRALIDALKFASFKVHVTDTSIYKGRPDFEETVAVSKFNDTEIHDAMRAALILKAEASIGQNQKILAAMGFDPS